VNLILENETVIRPCQRKSGLLRDYLLRRLRPAPDYVLGAAPTISFARVRLLGPPQLGPNWLGDGVGVSREGLCSSKLQRSAADSRSDCIDSPESGKD
jgi:hypothetical protein